MQAQVEVLKTDIKSFTVADAQGKDDKQISDINAFVSSGNCDALIVSPNTTAALTPAIEAACKKLPVVVFDRGVLTDCPVTFVNPVGGYGWGIQTANFIVSKLPKGGKVLALRILPGVDVLETRWSAANRIFKENGVNVVGAEFTGGDNAKTKAIVDDYINRFGNIDAVWMDAGATAVAALEAFEDAGKPYPIITGEDQEDFLKKWKEKGLTAMAPTYPTYQWRSPVIAAVRDPEGRAGDRTDLEAAAACTSCRRTSTSMSMTKCPRCTMLCAAARTCPAIRKPGAESRSPPDCDGGAPAPPCAAVQLPNTARRFLSPSVARASWLRANGRQIDTALAISRISGVNASITIGPS